MLEAAAMAPKTAAPPLAGVVALPHLSALPPPACRFAAPRINHASDVLQAGARV